MAMKPHCDRCDKDMQDESFCSWVEVEKPFGMTERMIGHLHIDASRQPLMLCKDCTVFFYVSYLKSIGISPSIRSDIFAILYPPEQIKPVAEIEGLNIVVPETLPEPGRPLSFDENVDDDPNEIKF